MNQTAVSIFRPSMRIRVEWVQGAPRRIWHAGKSYSVLHASGLGGVPENGGIVIVGGERRMGLGYR